METKTLIERNKEVLDLIQKYKDDENLSVINKGLEMEKWIGYNSENIKIAFEEYQDGLTLSFNQENLDVFLSIKEVLLIKYPELVYPHYFLDQN